MKYLVLTITRPEVHVGSPLDKHWNKGAKIMKTRVVQDAEAAGIQRVQLGLEVG